MARAVYRGRGWQALYKRLYQAYGPQYWWPTHDRRNPRFEILVGAVLVQHTAWRNVEKAMSSLCRAGPLTAETLLAHEDLESLIRSAGTYRIKAARLRNLCQWFIDAGGFAAIATWDTEQLCQSLRALSGLGPETADVIALYAFERPRFIADAYAFRLFARYSGQDECSRYDDLARLVMDRLGSSVTVDFYNELHALIVAHAKQICHKRQPACRHCILADHCAHRQSQLFQNTVPTTEYYSHHQ